MSTRHSSARLDRICSDKLLGRGLPICKKQLAERASDHLHPTTLCATTASCLWVAASPTHHPSRIPQPPPVPCSSTAPSTTANPSSSSSSIPKARCPCSRIPPPPATCCSRRIRSTASDTVATLDAGMAASPTISLTIKTCLGLPCNPAPHRLSTTGYPSTVGPQARNASHNPYSSTGTRSASLSTALAGGSLTSSGKQRKCQPSSAASSPRGPITPTATIRAWSPRRCRYSSADLELKLACPGSVSDLWLSGGSGLELPETSVLCSQPTEADDFSQSSLESWEASAFEPARPTAATQDVAQGCLEMPEAAAGTCPLPAAPQEPAQAACASRGELDYWLVDTAQCSWLSDGPLDEAFLVPGGGMAERWLNQVLAEADAREAELRASIAKL